MGHQTIIDLENGAPDIHAERSGELHDVNEREGQGISGRFPRNQKAVARKLPWSGLLGTEPLAGSGGVIKDDVVSIRYALHSNTKLRQLGGFYENYSTLGQGA